jgi:DNA-binding response OmpR family regulator
MWTALGVASASDLMRLLIVEDEADLRESLTKAMREEGYAVDAAPDGEEGLHKAESNDYDVI